MWDNDSARKARLPEEWGKLRVEILKRDHWKCQQWLPKSRRRCGRPANQVDHREPGDDHRPKNLRSMCEFHHAKKSAREGRAAKAAKKASRFRPREEHPGRVS